MTKPTKPFYVYKAFNLTLDPAVDEDGNIVPSDEKHFPTGWNPMTEEEATHWYSKQFISADAPEVLPDDAAADELRAKVAALGAEKAELAAKVDAAEKAAEEKLAEQDTAHNREMAELTAKAENAKAEIDQLKAQLALAKPAEQAPPASEPETVTDTDATTGNTDATDAPPVTKSRGRPAGTTDTE